MKKGIKNMTGEEVFNLIYDEMERLQKDYGIKEVSCTLRPEDTEYFRGKLEGLEDLFLFFESGVFDEEK